MFDMWHKDKRSCKICDAGKKCHVRYVMHCKYVTATLEKFSGCDGIHLKSETRLDGSMYFRIL